MKNRDLLKAINDIDDDMILEAAPGRTLKKAHRPFWIDIRFLSGAAAVMLMFVMLLPLASGNMKKNESDMLPTGDKSAHAEELAVEMKAPETFRDSEMVEYQAVDEQTVCAKYCDDKGEVLLTITRKAVSDSGNTEGEKTAPAAVDMEYNGTVPQHEWRWHKGSYEYSVVSSEELSPEELQQLIDSVE
ncbi:MAG: hypothetical protein IJI05_05130 [Erysipelotrichaceae bacterium]|nr:hypothetical protein [Erysipelotrichaceae bacterium]